jgi:formylmethanofuran dehydrogenase subunit E
MKKRAQGVPPTQISKEEAWEMVNIIWEAPESEVLSIGQVKECEWGDDFGEIMGLVPCDNCGELVARAYIRLVGKRKMCIPCSGYGR